MARSGLHLIHPVAFQVCYASDVHELDAAEGGEAK